jgi:ferredoxin
MAQYFSALILLVKGYRIQAMHSIDLPSNWISFHPGIKQTVVESIFERRKHETERLADKILKGKKDFRSLYDLIQDLLITPIAILYYFIGRYFLAKSFYANTNCNNCDRCIEQCPVEAIKLVDSRPFWTHRCESCMQCMNNCPERAIETGHGYLIGIWILVDTVILFWLYQTIGLSAVFELIPYPFLEYLAKLFFDSVVLIGCIFMSYRLVHWSIQFSIIEKIIRYTSLTTFSFWRRYNVKKMPFWKKYHFPKMRIKSSHSP